MNGVQTGNYECSLKFFASAVQVIPREFVSGSCAYRNGSFYMLDSGLEKRFNLVNPFQVKPPKECAFLLID